MDGGRGAAQSGDMRAVSTVRATGHHETMIDTQPDVSRQQEEKKAVDGTSNPLRAASINRLACLFRHWTWADEAMAEFERELADGWVDGEDPLADHPFGAYYHWCALLCAFSEAALAHELLPGPQLEALRPDLEASLPRLQACRHLLVVIPASLEEHPRIADLLRDGQTLGRLRRLHQAFGQALRDEHVSRELDLLLYEH